VSGGKKATNPLSGFKVGLMGASATSSLNGKLMPLKDFTKDEKTPTIKKKVLPGA
jgi:hypothetical protein